MSARAGIVVVASDVVPPDRVYLLPATWDRAKWPTLAAYIAAHPERVAAIRFGRLCDVCKKREADCMADEDGQSTYACSRCCDHDPAGGSCGLSRCEPLEPA